MMLPPRHLRTIMSAVLTFGVLVYVAIDSASSGAGLFGSAISAALVAAPYAFLTVVAGTASWILWLIVTLAMVAMTVSGYQGIDTDAQGAIAFIFIIPLQLVLAAAAGWRLMWPLIRSLKP